MSEPAVVPPPAPGREPEQFDRSMSLVATFSLGFTYLSPLAALAGLLPLALATGGPPAVWWLPIVASGQMLVALVFGEVVSQYPITGGVYPWARRLWGRRYAWVVAWVYLCALVVTITSVVEFGAIYVGALFDLTMTPTVTLLVAVAMLVLALGLNSSGTRTLGRVARVGFFAELIGVIGYGLYLLVFERKNSFGVFFDSMGVAGDGSYAPAFVAASLAGLFLFYGFEACGDVAEEVTDPARQVPRAMIYTILLGLLTAAAAFVGFIMAAPDLQSIVDGEVADPVTAILEGSVGAAGTTVFLVIAVTAFISCTLSLQAALSRLIFSFARDDMLPGSAALKRLTAERMPRNALLVACVAPVIVCLYVFVAPDSLPRVTAFAILGIYLCFQLVVLAALRQRLRGWRPAGPWSLGRAGFLVNVVALAYGVTAMVILALPGDASLPFVDRWVVLIGLAVVLGTGGAYMALRKPYGRSTAPEGDALEVAAQLRASPRSGGRR